MAAGSFDLTNTFESESGIKMAVFRLVPSMVAHHVGRMLAVMTIHRAHVVEETRRYQSIVHDRQKTVKP